MAGQGIKRLSIPYATAAQLAVGTNQGDIIHDLTNDTIVLGGVGGKRLMARADRVAQALTPTGDTTDRGPDLSAASAAATAQGAFVLSGGSYTVNTQPNIYGTTVVNLGGSFAGTSGIPGITDQTALQATAVTFSKLMIAAGNATLASANENVVYFSGYLNPTSAQASYQKNTSYTTLIHADPSSYSTPGDGVNAAMLITAKDGCGDDVQVSIAPGNMTGRIFARDSITSYPAGSDGAGTVQEMKSVNNASSQPFYGSSTSKHILNMFAAGQFYHTSGIYLDIAEAGGGGVGDAVMVTRQAVINNLLMYRQTASTASIVYAQITRDGQARYRGGLGIGNATGSSAAMGALVNKMPIYDMNGNLLGYVPIYAS